MPGVRRFKNRCSLKSDQWRIAHELQKQDIFFSLKKKGGTGINYVGNGPGQSQSLGSYNDAINWVLTNHLVQ